MKKKRLIPVLLLKSGWLVQSRQFGRYQNLGNPVPAVRRLSEWGADELIYLDITTDKIYDTRRDDLAYQNRGTFLEIISDVSKVTFMPMTVGGGIKTLQNIEDYLSSGADKVSINSEAIRRPEFIYEASRIFGSQCIVASIDFKKESDGIYKLYNHLHRRTEKWTAVDWAKKIQDMGAGEILLNSVDRDGMCCGYDLSIIDLIAKSLEIPVVACGGAGDWEHFAECLGNTAADGAAAANIFHFKDQSVFLARKYLISKNIRVRKPSLINLGHK